MKKLLPILLLLLLICPIYGQEVSLFEQFNGRYDFTFVGNTLNPAENNTSGNCGILTSSSATMNLGASDTVLKAYLYWAGSGSGDTDIKLNGQDIQAQRVMPLNAINIDNTMRMYFSAWADVTSIVSSTGNGTYTVSDFDLTEVVALDTYCGNATNFGGWAIIVVYSNPSLPLNQLNLYDGMSYVPNEVTINLPSLNVIDNNGAKIGFLAWEGDSSLAINETLRINGNILSNPPLNPTTNAFNGTNSITNSSTLYNMDLDVYNIQNYIHIGDQNAQIQLTSGRDFVIINAIVTKLNSQLPDATVVVNNVVHTCNSRTLQLNYTVKNENSTDLLPAGTQVGVYVNGDLITTFATNTAIPIGGSETGVLNLTIPAGYPEDFQILLIADYNFAITETDETNNSYTLNESLWLLPPLPSSSLTACETAPGANTGSFNLDNYATSVRTAPSDIVTFYLTQQDAQTPQNAVTNTAAYTSGPGTLYVRIEDEHGCVNYGTLTLRLDDCLYPDAVILNASTNQACNTRTMDVTFTIGNPNSQDVLPAGTPVAIFVNNTLVATVPTTSELPVNGTEAHTITVTAPEGAGLSFNIFIRADYGNTVQEINEVNNSFTLPVSIWTPPLLPSTIPDFTVCETFNNSNRGLFDFSAYITSLKDEPTDVVTFHETLVDAQAGTAAITNPGSYTSNGINPQSIYVRLQDINGCFVTGEFRLISKDCLFPDAVVTINTITQQCDSRQLVIDYTVSNPNSFDVLPANTPVAFYINGISFGITRTITTLPVNGSETKQYTITVPESFGSPVSVILAADDAGNGAGTITETNELNNLSNTVNITFWISPVLTQPADVYGCETFNHSGIGSFDFSAYETSLKNLPTDNVTFYSSLVNAQSAQSPITNLTTYNAAPDAIVYVRLQNVNGCYDIKQFTLKIKDCYFPDATVTIDDIYKQCNSRVLHVHYTVKNLLGTDVLPAGTPVSIYADGQFIDYTETIEDIAIGGIEQGYITITIPVGIALNFDLQFVADDRGDGTGTGIVIETDETNNSFTMPAELVLSPVLQQPDDITNCDQGFGLAGFDFSAYAISLKNYPNETVTFYTSQQNADQDLDRIYNTADFRTQQNPQRIYVRLDNGTCFATASFLLRTKKCKPITYNYITPNNDGYNDTFVIDGLRNIFFNFKLKIYNRWGNLVWTGDHSTADWNGIATEQKVGNEDTTVPNSTYYFVLELNDPDYPEPITDWIYVTK